MDNGISILMQLVFIKLKNMSKTTKKMSNKIKATAFEVLQKKLTIEDTLEFREKHLQEILEAMEEYKNQNKDE